MPNDRDWCSTQQRVTCFIFGVSLGTSNQKQISNEFFIDPESETALFPTVCKDGTSGKVVAGKLWDCVVKIKKLTIEHQVLCSI